MANILTAAAEAAKERIKSTATNIKDEVVNQFDPRQSIYQLGLGIGPMIRQTVAEFNKQQNKERKNTDKSQKKDIGDIKRDTTKNAKSLQKAAMHLGSIDKSLKEIRKINNVQLQAQLKMIRAERVTAGATVGADLMSIFKSSKSSDGAKSTSPQKDDEEGSTLGTIAKIGAGLAIGGVLWSNRAEIKKFLDQFLEGAGLPSTEKLADQAGKAISDTTVKVASMVGAAIIDGVKAALIGLPGMVYDHIKEALGLGKDDKGNPLPADQRPIGADVGFATGAYYGKKAFGWKGAVFGGITGGLMGYASPEAALLAGGAAVSAGFARKALVKANTVPTPTPTAPVTATAAVPAVNEVAMQTTRQERRAMFTEKYQELKNQGMKPGEAREAAKDFVKQTTTTGAKEAASLSQSTVANATAQSTIAASTPLSQTAKAVVKDAVNAKNILKRGAVGGVISGLFDYQEHGDVTGALITASLSTIGAGLGTAVGALFGAGVGGVVGNIAGGYLGEKAANAINEWRGHGKEQQPAGPTPTVAPAGSSKATGRVVSPVDNPLASKGEYGEDRGDHVHAGVDISAKKGDAVRSVSDGVVLFAGVGGTGYGNLVDIEHDDKKKVRYAHLDQIYVKTGQRVKAGDIIGTVGNSGTGAVHLHIEAFDENGRSIDPRSFIPGIPAYSGHDNGRRFAVDRQFIAGGGGSAATSINGVGVAGNGAGGGIEGTVSSEINVKALRSMGLKEDQIKALTDKQQYLGEMSDIASLLPMLMGMDAGGGGAGGGRTAQGGQSVMKNSGPYAYMNQKVQVPTGDPGSAEKNILNSRLGSGTWNLGQPAY